MKDQIKEQVIKFLEGEKVYLRPIEMDDLDFLYTQAFWNKESRRLTGTQTVFTRTGVEQFYENAALDSSRIDLLICLQANNQPIGDIAMMDIDHRNRNAIVRISIFDQENWGSGYGTEAMSAVLDFGFNILNMHRIGLDVFSFNGRGIKSYQKLGFKQEGIIRDALFYDGSYHDSILMGVLSEEFTPV